MSSSFNPYAQWLGLSEQEHRPTHYQLLGIERSEKTDVKIRAAYYRRVAKVSVFQHGQDADLCQKLLEELAVARDVLLNTQRRARYDERLDREEQATPSQSAPASSTPRPEQRSATQRQSPVAQSTRRVTPQGRPAARTTPASAAQAAASTLSPTDVERLFNAKRAAELGSSRSSEPSARGGRNHRPFGMFSVMRTPEELLKEIVETRGLSPYQAQCFVADEAEQLIVGPYIIESEVAAGTWGELFVATRISTGEQVVLRKLIPSLQTQLPELKRLIQKTERLEGAGFQQAIDCGSVNNQPFFACELVLGEDLRRLVSRDGPMSGHQAIYCVDQTAKQLGAAQAAGLAHLELRPNKILVDRSGKVVVRDLAIANLISKGKKKITDLQKLTQIIPHEHLCFCSPETIVNDVRLRPQADIYSLGCILYFCMTGQKLFEETDPLRTVIAHRESSVPSVLDFDATLPPDFDTVLGRMLAKQPGQRYQSHNELRQALMQLYQQLPRIDVKPSSLWPHVRETLVSPDALPSKPLGRFHWGRLLTSTAAGLTLVGLLGGGAYYVMNRPVVEPPPEPVIAESPVPKTDPGPTVLRSGSDAVPVIQAEEVFRVK